MIPPLDPSSGFLPVGRTLTDLDSIRDRFSFNPRRQKIWADFMRSTNAIRSVTPIASAWVGGSFVSSKEDPSDIDVVYFVRAEEYDQLPGESRKRLNIFRGGQKLFAKGMQVDSYVIDWVSRNSEHPDGPREQEPLAHRGYWDDWLQRAKLPDFSGLVGVEPTRGYLEVILDGYQS